MAVDPIKYYAQLDREDPERWRAWCDELPATTTFGSTPGEAIDILQDSEEMHEFHRAKAGA